MKMKKNKTKILAYHTATLYCYHNGREYVSKYIDFP